MKTKLYFFTENLTAVLYRSILKMRLPEKELIYAPDRPGSLPANWAFLQDNDPKHKAKSTMRFLKRRVRNCLISHPAQSPDLNVLEDIWSYLDRKSKRSRREDSWCPQKKAKKRVVCNALGRDSELGGEHAGPPAGMRATTRSTHSLLMTTGTKLR